MKLIRQILCHFFLLKNDLAYLIQKFLKIFYGISSINASHACN